MFNKNLKNLRELHGLSQKAMAEQLHIAPTTYRNYENTLREPSFNLLVKIAQTLNTSIDYMLDNSAHKPKVEQILSKLEALDDESLLQAELFIDFLISENKRKQAEHNKA
ncbi:MAG: helix-turn-helix transcriptional regulator [Clostridia bacterium]|nr:helix-turn-helix transcriptional regulator [Clostridia bacterium]